MDIVIRILQLVLALSLLVAIHEFGHYLFARICGIRVDKFYLFFNPWFSIVRWNPRTGKVAFFAKNSGDAEPPADPNHKPTWRDTEYGIGWLPLGGYCKIAGMIDESMDKEQMAQPARPDEFRSHPAYQRLAVMLGGVFFNFVLALLIYIGVVWCWGDSYIPYEKAAMGMNFTDEAEQAGYRDGDILLWADGVPLRADEPQMKIVTASEVGVLRDGDTVIVRNPENFPLKLANGFFEKNREYRMPVQVAQVSAGSSAEKSGLQVDDYIVAVNSVATPEFTDLERELLANAGREIPLTLVRGNDTIETRTTPSHQGKIGFIPQSPVHFYDVEVEKYNFFQSVPKGITYGTSSLVNYVSSLKMLFTKDGMKQVGGFGAIAEMYDTQWDWFKFWQMTAFLSIILAFMNILPIPALDGGHVIFVLWEIVTRKKPSEKVLEYSQIVGLVILVALLIYANGNDIYRIFFK